jgi:hypothetical protein
LWPADHPPPAVRQPDVCSTLAIEPVGILELLGQAWSAWKLSVERVGPAGAAVVAVLAVVGFVLLRECLDAEYPGLAEALEQAV